MAPFRLYAFRSILRAVLILALAAACNMPLAASRGGPDSLPGAPPQSTPAAAPATPAAAVLAPVAAKSTATPLPTPSPTPTPPPSLGTLAREQGVWIGSSVSPGLLSEDSDYAQLLLREFNSVTPENAMKFEVIHPEPGVYDFSGADAIVEFAGRHGLLVRGHTLVWDNQLPPWIVNGEYTREEWIAILRDHIHTVVGRYRGRVAAWDVVNEAFSREGALFNTHWLRVIGPEYLALSFQWAHEADPDALLFYNDNGGEGLTRQSEAIYALMQGLLAAGVPVHGVGMQMHTTLETAPTPHELAANMERLAALGLQVHITEMDVRTQYSSASDEEKLLAQAQVYQNVLGVCLSAANCTLFATWGINDAHSWIRWYTGNDDMPLLFDRESKPKPAYEALMALFR